MWRWQVKRQRWRTQNWPSHLNMEDTDCPMNKKSRHYNQVNRWQRWFIARLQYLQWRYCSLAINHQYISNYIPLIQHVVIHLCTKYLLLVNKSNYLLCATTSFYTNISYRVCTSICRGCILVRSQRCSCLATWFCYQLIAKPGNKTAAPSYEKTEMRGMRIKSWHVMHQDVIQMLAVGMCIHKDAQVCICAHINKVKT